MLAKPSSIMIWPTIVDVADEVCAAKQSAPPTVEEMGALLRSKTFTNGADADVVLDLFQQTATAVLGNSPKILFRYLGWGDTEIEQLCKWLVACDEVEKLDLQLNCDITDTGL